MLATSESIEGLRHKDWLRRLAWPKALPLNAWKVSSNSCGQSSVRLYVRGSVEGMKDRELAEAFGP